MTKILHIDDSPTFRELLGRYLPDTFELFSANDGEEGFDKALQVVPDIVITDLNMPGCSVLDLIERLNQHESLKATQYVVLTNEADRELKSRGAAIGVRAWLRKPLQKEHLEKVLQKIVTPA